MSERMRDTLFGLMFLAMAAGLLCYGFQQGLVMILFGSIYIYGWPLRLIIGAFALVMLCISWIFIGCAIRGTTNKRRDAQ